MYVEQRRICPLSVVIWVRFVCTVFGLVRAASNIAGNKATRSE
jgi:hypothetical protein